MTEDIERGMETWGEKGTEFFTKSQGRIFV